MTTQFALLRQAQDDATPVSDGDAFPRSPRRPLEPEPPAARSIEDAPPRAASPAIPRGGSDPAPAEKVLSPA